MLSVKPGSAATESIGNRLEPVSVQSLSGAPLTHFSCVRTGRRTSCASGCQLPAAPLSSTGRNFNGPKADAPRSFSGLRVATAVVASSRTRRPSATLSVVCNDSSSVAMSILCVRGKWSGTTAFTANERVAVNGSSSGELKCICNGGEFGEADADDEVDCNNGCDEVGDR